MFLNRDIPYIKSKRNHFLVAILLSIAIVFIIIFLKPFGAGQSGQSTFRYQNFYFSGYGVLIFFSYFMVVKIFAVYYKKIKKWKGIEEIFFLLSFATIALIMAHFYTELVINKNPSRVNPSIFIGWLRTMFPSFGVLLMVLSFFLRRYFGEIETNDAQQPSIMAINDKETLTIKGTLKKEKLTINFSEFAYVKSEDNYVFLYYFKEGVLENKMLRSTLSNIHKQVPKLLKTHRSFLINPIFINCLKGNSQNAKLLLKQVEAHIPVSKTYYSVVKEVIN